MKALTNDEFAKLVMKMASPQRPFRPSATYDAAGDCIEFIIKPDDFYAHRIDDFLTVYYSEENGELVGSFIKNAKAFCRQLIERNPWLAIIIEEPPVRLSHLFVARLMNLPGSPDQEQWRVTATTYKELIRYAERENIEMSGEACTT